MERGQNKTYGCRYMTPVHDALIQYYTYDLAAKQNFTEAEEVKFRHRLEEGFDITTDQRYNEWLEANQLAGNAELRDDTCTLNFSSFESLIDPFDELTADVGSPFESECK